MIKSLIFFLFAGVVSGVVHGQHLASDLHGVRLKSLDGQNMKFSFPKNKITVFVTLGTDCPISQKYIPIIEELKKSYADRIEWIAIFPEYFSIDEVTAFKKEYTFSVQCYIDKEMELVRLLNASVTPEVFLFGSDHQLQYRGAIDNWYYDLGRYRTKITDHYLKNAIESLLKNNQIEKPVTEAIGCPIQLTKATKQSIHPHH